MTTADKHLLRKGTPPYRARLPRAHAPIPGRALDGWKKFRSCLRWEFGFTCAICLLHERDFVPPHTGAARTGQLAIEHIEARSLDPLRANDYANCLYLCRFCNGTKLGQPTVDPVSSARLLNPVDHVWSDHFEIGGDELAPCTPDARYTCDCYGINDDMRTQRRRSRYDVLERLERRIGARLHDIAVVDEDLTDPALPAPKRQEKQSQRGRWRRELLDDLDDLYDWTGIPPDNDARCYCKASCTIVAVIADGWRAPPVINVPEAPGSPARRFRA